MQLGVFVIVSMLILIGIGMAVFVMNIITENLAVDVDIGQVNLKNVTDDTLGQIDSAFTDNADKISIAVLLGMIILMFGNAYYFGQKLPKLFIILDIFLLVFFFIVSVYVAQNYEIFINASDILDVYINDMPLSSAFILNLPIYVSIIGVIIMILSYAGVRKLEQSGDVNLGNF